MRIRLNAPETVAALGRIEILTIDLATAHSELRRRYAEDRDGYPTRSSLEGRTSGNAISDPVGELVAGMVDVSGDVGHALAEMVRKIFDAQRSLEGALAEYHELSRRPETAPIALPDNRQVWCSNGEKQGVRHPLGERPRRGMCRFCETFDREHGMRPSRRILDARDRGRLTDRLVAEEVTAA